MVFLPIEVRLLHPTTHLLCSLCVGQEDILDLGLVVGTELGGLLIGGFELAGKGAVGFDEFGELVEGLLFVGLGAGEGLFQDSHPLFEVDALVGLLSLGIFVLIEDLFDVRGQPLELFLMFLLLLQEQFLVLLLLHPESLPQVENDLLLRCNDLG